jgi:hypothetical protein
MKNIRTQHCIQTYPFSTEERGGVLVFLALFMTGMIGLLALAVDGHFLLQSRLEEQNIAEYFSLAAMTGYEKEPSDDFEAKRNAAIVLLMSIDESNTVTGMNQGWDFSDHSCSGVQCSGDGWALTFGQWHQINNEGSFIPGQSVDEEDPNAVDTSSIDAITLQLQYQKNNLLQFFNKPADGSNSVAVNTVAYRVDNGSRRILRLAKITAGGKAY